MSEEMNRMFGGSQEERTGWLPAIEIAERDGKYIVHAELPGLKPDDVKVEVMDDSMVIQGERKSQSHENKEGIHRSERHYGRFYRVIPLPEGTSPEQVRATFNNGILEVTAPAPQREPQSNRRQIPIRTEPEKK